MTHFIRPATLRSPDSEIDRHTTWLEIFFDLIFAVIVVQLSDRLSSNLTLTGIVQCSALFIPSMWTWASYTVFAARFDNNDAIHWLGTFVIMFAGAIMAIQIPTALEDGATGFSIGFLIGQISILLFYSRTLHDHGTPKDMIYFYFAGFGLGAIFWIISLFFPPPIKFVLWTIGMSIYFFTPWVGRKRVFSKAPLHTMYIPERFGSFTIIILGQIIASVVFGLETASWDYTSVFISILAFLLAIIIWGQYYLFNKIANYKCTLGSGQPYIYWHIPMIISLILIGVCSRDYIANESIRENVRIIFCSSLILYLISFYLLQIVAIPRIKGRVLLYLGGGTAAILALFLFCPLYPVLIMSGVVIIFMGLFAIQHRLDFQSTYQC